MIIVFEGIDGSGKTTVSKKIYQELSQIFPSRVFWFSEPSQTTLGKNLKSIITSKEITLTTLEQTLLFTTDRSFLLRNYIIPYNNNNNIIIMDRSFISTYTYQIMNEKDERIRELMKNLTELSIRDFYIDILFYLDCPSEISLSRITEKDGIESKGVNFIEQVRRNYLDFLNSNHPNIKKQLVIDTKKPFKEVYSEVRSYLLEKLGYVV